MCWWTALRMKQTGPELTGTSVPSVVSQGAPERGERRDRAAGESSKAARWVKSLLCLMRVCHPNPPSGFADLTPARWEISKC